MKKKKHGFSIGRAITSFFMLIPAVINLMRSIGALIETEVRLAGSNLLRIIVLSQFFLILLTSLWVGLIGLLWIGLHSLQLSWTVSLLITLGINLLLLIIVWFSIRDAKHNMFSATAKIFRKRH